MLAWEHGLPGRGKSVPGGLKIAPRGSNFGPRGVRNGLLEVSRGALGTRSVSGGRSGRKRGSWKIVRMGLGALWGPSWRVLGPFWVSSPPPGGGRGGSGRSFLEVFGRSRPRPPKKLIFLSIFVFFGCVLLCFFCRLLPSLLRNRRRRAYGKKLKNHWFLWVASHMPLFRATPRGSKFQRARVANIDRKTAPKNTPKGARKMIQKRPFLRPKCLPKWTPEASGNVCGRRSATEAAKNAA